jgi:type IX secretion system substrate protein/carboxypeptidase family protein
LNHGFVTLNQKQILMKNPTKLLLLAFLMILSSLILNAQQDSISSIRSDFPDSKSPGLLEGMMNTGLADAVLSASCNYQIALYSEDNGWHSSFVSVYVDGNLVLENLTFSMGYGPIYWDFLVESGEEITTIYQAGTQTENDSYTIVNTDGNVVFTDGENHTTPSGIGPGELSGLCPWGDVEGYVVNGDGLIIVGAAVGIESLGVSSFSGTDGYYILLDIPSGEQTITAWKSGYNQNQQSITVLDGVSIGQDFTLTQPTMIINPLILDETLHPFEAKIKEISILNNGDGPLDWEAEIAFTSDAGGFIKNPANKKPVITGISGHAGQAALLEEATKGTQASDASRDLFECNSGALFGNSPNGTNNAFQSQYGGATQAYQSCNGLTGAWNMITFWGVYTSGTPTTDDFFIGVYEDGVQPEAEIASYIVSLDPIPTGEMLSGFEIYQYTATIDTHTETDFFISCQATAEMFWCNSPTGSGTSGTGPMWSLVDPLAVCIDEPITNNWLTLTQYQGNVSANGGTNNLFAIFNASGFSSGDYVTATITFTSTPDVGTIVVPVSMTVAGDPFLPPENLDVVLDEINGKATLSWELSTQSGFQYFKIDRNNIFIATTNAHTYFDYLPEYGTYCYTVTAVYVLGASASAGPSCVTWPEPGLMVNPNMLEATVWTDNQTTVNTRIYNTGIGTLAFSFPMYDNADAFSCQQEVVLYDDYGDGWNGGALTVYVDDLAVLTDITLATGGGPEPVSFNAESGAEITTSFTCGSWCYENYYEIFDGEGMLIATDGMGGNDPTGIAAGLCYASCPQPSFIIDVEPSSGYIAEGHSRKLTITYDATDFDEGDYDEWLYLESNDPDHLTDSIFNTMHVLNPGRFAGNITDGNTTLPINGVQVRAGSFTTTTDPNGDYELYVDPGIYNLNFDKVGYQSLIVPDTTVTGGQVTLVDSILYESLYAPGWVTATVNEDDTECLVEWTDAWGAYEILYDDGSADDYLVYTVAGNGHAVRFTPAGYPATIVGGSVYVGDGSFPINADFIGSVFGVLVMDDDGTDGLPGSVFDSAEVVVDTYGWVNFRGLEATIEDGDFYLVIIQGGVPPYTIPVGIDQTPPTVYRSYSYIAAADQWFLSPYQDFMIRSVVYGPQSGADMLLAPEKVQPPKPLYKHYIATGQPTGLPGYVKSGEIKPISGFDSDNSRAATGYKLARMSNFNPCYSPGTGDTMVMEACTSMLLHNDQAWGGLDEGWYAYGVSARYNNGGNVQSNYTFSNIVGKDKKVAISVSLTTTTGALADSADVVLSSLNCPMETYSGNTQDTCFITFYPVWKNCHSLFVGKVGHKDVFIDELCFDSDDTVHIVLAENQYAPHGLYVDSLSSIATWDEAKITALWEDFEGEEFPPEGWVSSSDGPFGWFRTDDGSSYYFQVPDWDSYFACLNDDMSGSQGHGCCDYLITPALDLREANAYSLKFDQYYTGQYYQLAFVEISFDAGETWIVEEQMTPTGGVWARKNIDLSAYSSNSDIPNIWLAFHADDQGQIATGWAIDNVEVSVGNDGDAPPQAYHVFLNDAFVTETQETTYQFLNLIYGVEYTAAVGALYSSGLSEKDYYSWTSKWLYPPEQLVAASYDDAVHLIWDPPSAPWYEVLSVAERKINPNPNTEYSPMQRQIQNNSPAARDDWDTQFSFPCGDASGEAGIESDGSYIYTTKWNAGNGTFFRYELDGTFLGAFTVSGPCMDVRDLAYDGEYFYGSNASTSLWQMSFDDEVVVSTINSPVACRAIAYDEDFDAFWANNWSDNITLFDANGTVLNSFACGAYASYYGFAYDEHISGGPYLYGFSQDGSGAVIVEIKIATGTETGTSYDAIDFSTTGIGLAGGLFIQYGLVSDYITLGGMIQNETIFGLEFGENEPPNCCYPPENLIGFNVYRDGALQEYVEYFGESQMSWWQYDLQPDLYSYSVTAVYDLAPYGFPNQEDESTEEGPVEIRVSFGFPLPFLENWETASFDDKNWQVQCENWEISPMVGNPGFSAEFKWDPIRENYDCGIITYPILGSVVDEGDIFLDFDLKIDDRFDTVYTEKLVVRIWANNEWTDKEEFIAMGDMDWEMQHYNITQQGKGADFKIGFFAMGENSINIDAWFIDNVHVYQVCSEPSQLTSEVIFETQEMAVVELNWLEPYSDYKMWLSYNDGSFEDAIASTDGGAGLAQKFTPEHYPVTITKIRYFNSAYDQCTQECEIYVLSGDGEDILSGPFFINNGPADDWVTLDINDITLGSGKFMLATFNVNPGGPYIGMDDSYYDGSLYFGSIGDFDEMGTFQYYYVGSHEAYVEYAVGDNVVVNSVLSAPLASNSHLLSNIKLSGTSAHVPASNNRDVTGYNIWRNDELIASNWPSENYLDTLYEDNEYCYYISAVFDQCESDTLGLVCETFYLDVDEPASGLLEIYPNPTSEKLRIVSPLAIERITVVNNVGNVVKDLLINDQTNIELDVSDLEPGIYILKVVTAKGTRMKKMTVM